MIRFQTSFLSAAVAAALCALAAAAAAPADARVRVADFDVTVKGVQKNTWTQNDPAHEHLCDPLVTGAGSETYSFRSRRPQRVRAVMAGR